MAFVAKKQPVPCLKLAIPVSLGRLCSEHPNTLFLRSKRRGEETLPIIVVVNIERLPVIHSTALQVAVGDGEAKGTNQVEAAVHKSTQTPDVPGVLRNLWIKEDDVTTRLSHR